MHGKCVRVLIIITIAVQQTLFLIPVQIKFPMRQNLRIRTYNIMGKTNVYYLYIFGFINNLYKIRTKYIKGYLKRKQIKNNMNKNWFYLKSYLTAYIRFIESMELKVEYEAETLKSP